MRRRIMTGGLSVTELVAWGTLVYAFSALVVPMRDELGWSPFTFTAVYTAGWLVSGLAGVPLGRVLARRSPHAVMLTGAVLAALALAGWAGVGSRWAFAIVFAVAGIAMAATLYEPAFVCTARWFDERSRARAVAAVTMVAGLAGSVFVPLTGALSAALGWRTTLLVLAGAVVAVSVPVHVALLVRDRSAGPPPAPAATPDRPSPLRRASLRWIVLSLACATAVKSGVVVLLVAFLVADGYRLGTATLIAGLVGVLQVAGRFGTAALRGRVSERTVSVVLFGLQAVALVALAVAPGPGVLVPVAVACFALGAGQAELLRGTLLVTLYGRDEFPRTNGVVSPFVTGARGAGPLLAGALVTATGSYVPALLATAGLAVVAAVALPVGLRRTSVDRTTGAPRLTTH